MSRARSSRWAWPPARAGHLLLVVRNRPAHGDSSFGQTEGGRRCPPIRLSVRHASSRPLRSSAGAPAVERPPAPSMGHPLQLSRSPSVLCLLRAWRLDSRLQRLSTCCFLRASPALHTVAMHPAASRPSECGQDPNKPCADLAFAPPPNQAAAPFSRLSSARGDLCWPPRPAGQPPHRSCVASHAMSLSPC
eukprot:scaffold8237_cov27-Tisochrysis_lutea.AAC.2